MIANIQKLQWVSEWRITDSTSLEKKYGWNYRVSNGGVYTNAKNLNEAKLILERNIRNEQRNYINNQLRCPNCNEEFAKHDGSRSYEICLRQLALDGRITKYRNGDTK